MHSFHPLGTAELVENSYRHAFALTRSQRRPDLGAAWFLLTDQGKGAPVSGETNEARQTAGRRCGLREVGKGCSWQRCARVDRRRSAAGTGSISMQSSILFADRPVNF